MLAPALVYVGYYSALGILLAFLPRHFAQLGFSGPKIGILMGLTPVVMSVTPFLWGYIADRFKKRHVLLRVASIGACFMMGAMYFQERYALVFAAVLGYAVFSAPLIPLTDAYTLNKVKKSGGSYSRIRMYGSMGFVASTAGFGFIAHRVGDPGKVAILIAAGCVLLSVVASFLTESDAHHESRVPTVRDAVDLLRDPRLIALFVASAVHWFAMSAYHAFFSVHVADLGLSPTIAGLGFATGAAAEILVMWFFPRFSHLAKAHTWLTIAFVAAALRWSLMSVVSDPYLLVATQSLHAIAFGVFYLAALEIIVSIVPDDLRATGQGLFFAPVFGLGGGLGSFAAGLSYERFGGSGMYGVSAVLAVVATLLSRRVRLRIGSVGGSGHGSSPP